MKLVSATVDDGEPMEGRLGAEFRSTVAGGLNRGVSA